MKVRQYILIFCLLVVVIGCASALSGLRSEDPTIKANTIVQLTAKDAQDLSTQQMLFAALNDEDKRVRYAAAQKVQQLNLTGNLTDEQRLRYRIALGQWDAVAAQCSKKTAEVLLEAYRRASSAEKPTIQNALTSLTCDEAREAIGTHLGQALTQIAFPLRTQAAEDVRTLGYGDKLPAAYTPYLAAVQGNYSDLAGPDNCETVRLTFLQRVVEDGSTPLEHKQAALLTLAGSQCPAATNKVLSALEKWPTGESLPSGFATALTKTDMTIAAYFIGVDDPRQALAALEDYRRLLKQIDKLSLELKRKSRLGTPPNQSVIVTASRLALLQVRTGQLPEAMASLAVADSVASYHGGHLITAALNHMLEALKSGNYRSLNATMEKVKKDQQKGRQLLRVDFSKTIQTIAEYQLQGAVKTGLARMILGDNEEQNKKERATGFLQNLQSAYRNVRSPETVDYCTTIIGNCLGAKTDKDYVRASALQDLGFVMTPRSFALITGNLTEGFQPHAYQSLALLDMGDWQRVWELLQSDNENKRFAAAFALGYGDDNAEVKQKLRSRLAVETSKRVKLGLHFALSRQNDNRSFNSLVAQIRSGNLLALQLVQWLPNERAKRVPTAVLIKQLDGETDSHKAFAAAILADGKHRVNQSAKKKLVNLLSYKTKKSVRVQAARVLAVDCDGSRTLVRNKLRALPGEVGSLSGNVEIDGVQRYYQSCDLNGADETVLLSVTREVNSKFRSEVSSLRYNQYGGDQNKAEKLYSAAASLTLMLGYSSGKSSRRFLIGNMNDEFLSSAAQQALLIQGLSDPQSVLAELPTQTNSINILCVRTILGDQEACEKLVARRFDADEVNNYMIAVQATGDPALAKKLVAALNNEDDPVVAADLADGLIKLAMAHPELFKTGAQSQP